jgi:hypothetical protein
MSLRTTLPGVNGVQNSANGLAYTYTVDSTTYSTNATDSYPVDAPAINF